MLPELLTSRQLTGVLSVLSAMITPAVLILASGSLILTTSNRLTRVVDRVREMLAELEQMGDSTTAAEKRKLLFDQLERSTKRARMLQHAMTRLYLCVAIFVATSVAIGLVALLGGMHFAWIPLLLGFIGAGLLLSASVHLIFESRLALQTTYAEMDYIWRMHMPEDRRSSR